MESITKIFNGYGAYVQPTLHIVLILTLALILLAFANKMIRTLRIYISSQSDNPEDIKRFETLGRVFRYIASVTITIVAGMLILSELGISIAPILATAGVVGLAIGFGAQSLIKDYFNGFFILIENQIRQGDVVEAAGKSGLVEELTLRYVRLRDYDGNVHFIPNGNISTVTNMSRLFSHSVIDVSIAYKEDIDQALNIMRQVGLEMKNDVVYKEIILEDVEIAGVEQWADSAIILRCRFKVKPLEQWGVRRELLKRLKLAFDANHIEIPFPHRTLVLDADTQKALSK